jgi:hypothetical protein
MLNIRRVSNDEQKFFCSRCNFEPKLLKVGEIPFGKVVKGKSYCLHVTCGTCDNLLATKQEGEM